MFYSNNIVNLPNDIHGIIHNNLENGRDIHNFKNSCKTFNNYVNYEKKINVDLFKISYKLIFNNSDINMHYSICKKMSKISNIFELYTINFNRSHVKKGGFDNSTTIYFDIFTDDIKENKDTLLNFIKFNKIKNYKLEFNIFIYFTDSFINNIITNFNKNNNDIIIENNSLQKLEINKIKCIHQFKKFIKENLHEYKLSNNKLFIDKIEIKEFLSLQVMHQENKIENSMSLLNNIIDPEIINKQMALMDNNVKIISKYNNLISQLKQNIIKSN
jgi:hypothetical protein